jgi:ribose transport system permease protein
MKLQPAVAALVGVIVIVTVVGGLTTSDFLTSDNVSAIVRNAAVVGTAAVGMALVTISGNYVSLSVQQTTMLAAIMLAGGLRADMPAGAVVLAVVVAAIVLGAVQGLFVSIGLNPVVATLAVGSIVYGGVQAIVEGELVAFGGGGVDWVTDSNVLFVPMPAVIFGLVTVAASVFSRRTVTGREMKLAGANRDTAAMSGISVGRAAVWSFALLGLTVAIAGIVTAIQVGQANASMLDTLTIDVASAVLVGGVAIQGGAGSPAQAAVGALFIALVSNLMVLNGFSAGARDIVSGLLVVGAVVAMHVFSERGTR